MFEDTHGMYVEQERSTAACPVGKGRGTISLATDLALWRQTYNRKAFWFIVIDAKCWRAVEADEPTKGAVRLDPVRPRS
jgi:hypothetical protein